MSTEQIQSMLNDFSDEDARKQRISEWIDNLPEDKLVDAMKAMDPTGVTLPAGDASTKESVSFSYTNMRLDYVMKLVTTALIGFIFRMLREYNVPEEIPAVDPLDFERTPSVLDTPGGIKDDAMKEKYRVYRESMPHRLFTIRFLMSIFSYDPDRHVASSLATNVKDPRRKHPKTEAARRAVRNKTPVQKAAGYTASEADMVDEPKNIEEEIAYNVIPPADTFSRLNRYMEEHYEQYQRITEAIYGATPDLDLAVCFYKTHRNDKEAKRFKETHMDQVIAPITNIKANAWVLLGPYQQNREKVDFYSKRTEILKEMSEQREADSKLAGDILKKRVKIKKQENIRESGPDHPEFRKYVKSNRPEVAAMGGEHITADDGGVDEADTVEVKVFTVDGGGREVKMHSIYNPVEAPIGAAAEKKAEEESTN